MDADAQSTEGQTLPSGCRFMLPSEVYSIVARTLNDIHSTQNGIAPSSIPDSITATYKAPVMVRRMKFFIIQFLTRKFTKLFCKSVVKELAKYSGRRSVIYRRYGLDFFSAPIVVGEPCPGYTFVLSGSDRSLRLIPSISC